ncbi:MAG: hypothetical protein LBT38_09830, partial [Deltaproteobacteria bacterium]|nr:hypothetical protein [Deltaproteobacteria bacterium]
ESSASAAGKLATQATSLMEAVTLMTAIVQGAKANGQAPLPSPRPSLKRAVQVSPKLNLSHDDTFEF